MENMEYFKRGAVISISHAMVCEPILTVIQKSEENNLSFKVPIEFLRSNVFKGDTVNCQVFGDEYEFVLKGMISDIDLQYPNYAHICVDKIDRYKNKRENRRYMVNLLANISLPNSDQKIYAIVKNIGLKGAGVVFKEKVELNINDKIYITAQVSEKDYLTFTANIIRIEPRGLYSEYGLRINDVDDINKDLLDKLIYQLEKDEAIYVKDSLK
ncbi:MAG: PilZ domain-containing protein [Bacillota bacterium]|nr:PilZ domain-containing protein [Bacillota bacterium]